MPICPSCRAGYDDTAPSCPKCAAAKPPAGVPFDIIAAMSAELPRCSRFGIFCMVVARVACLFYAVYALWQPMRWFGARLFQGDPLPHDWLESAGIHLLTAIINCGGFIAFGLAVKFARRE